MRYVVLACLFLAASFVSAQDLNSLKEKLPKVDKEAVSIDKVQDNTDVEMQTLSKQLKNVQNEKGPIVFKTGKAILDTAKCETTLKTVNDIIVAFPGFLVQIEGHTDNAGKAKANLTLSQKRADAVMAYLIKKYKTPAERMTAKGFGDTQPIADNKTADGRAKNRRVDFSVSRIKK